jgi:chromate transporter
MTGDQETMATAQREEATAVSVKSLFLSFLRLGLTAFGGPAMIAYIGELSVKRKKWLDQPTFKTGVALAQSIPGATAMQAAAYVGLKARGIPGALASYVGFGLPAFLFMVILSSLYAASRDLPWVTSLFHGLQVIVVAVVAHATYAFGRGTLRKHLDFLVAAASAGAFWLGASPFYVIVGAAILAIIIFKPEPAQVPTGARAAAPLPASHVIALLLALVIGLFCLYLAQPKLLTLALLMVKIDLFAFGGGFGSLPLMLQEVVNVKGWMDSKTFMDGIALGQVTPGPIVITATFVGYLLYGLLGAVVATIAIFTPSFVLLVITAPYFDRLKQSALFGKAIKGVLASFVGLLLFVTLKFSIAVPWDVIRGLIVVATFIALLRKIDILYIVPAGAALSLLLLR